MGVSAYLASGFGLIPHRRPTAATTYTVHADGTITTVAQTLTRTEAPGFDYSTPIAASFPFSVAWRFSTVAPVAHGPPARRRCAGKRARPPPCR